VGVSDLTFKEVEYGRTALTAVICQVRFNPILKIGQEVPANFQERIRSAFPKFSREESVELQIGLGEAAETLSPAVQALRRTAGPWRFHTEDDAWTASLATNFLGLETTQYGNFRDFLDRLRVIHDALQAEYRIAYYVRVGLRYVNLFTLEDFPGPWQEKFNPQLLGPLGDPIVGESITESRQTFVVAGDSWTIGVRHGTDGGSYRIDLDHATEEHVDPDELMDLLTSFNVRAYQVFRWAISDKLHAEMEPADE
jgi:uncharacterized protein (TIGR04255 family)